jgi:D-alanyl-D-alanine carboxypeptidase
VDGSLLTASKKTPAAGLIHAKTGSLSVEYGAGLKKE